MENQTTERRNPSHPEESCEDLDMPGFYVNRERLSRSLGSLDQGRSKRVIWLPNCGIEPNF